MTVAKYALFLFAPYSARGGMNDIQHGIWTMEACMAKAQESDHDQEAQIVDVTTMRVVKTGEWTYDPPPSPRDRITWRYEWKDAP